MASGTNTDHDHNSSPSETRSIDSEHHAVIQRNHRVSNPPPVIPQESGVSQDMMRHYSDPLPVQPQANKPRIVKALSNMRPPCFDVAQAPVPVSANNKNNTDLETFQNQRAVDVCLIMTFRYEMMDEEVGLYGDPIMYAMGDCIPQDVGDFGRGSGKKWQCGACTFKNHEWL
eukprot:682466_1